MSETRLNWLNTKKDYIRYLFAQAFGNAVAEVVAQELRFGFRMEDRYEDVIKSCWQMAETATQLLVTEDDDGESRGKDI
jgi:hypothetical protein